MKIMTVFGTRPEAIKMCPVVQELKKRDGAEVVVCVTGQHREMLQQVLDVFNVAPDWDLQVMETDQTLYGLTERVMSRMITPLIAEKPDAVLVHGDTTTAFAAALACFYRKIPVGHVEAGLRTRNIWSPFPEEFNRQAVDIIAKWHFAPTHNDWNHLVNEAKNPQNVYITGNTVIDAVRTTVRKDFAHPLLDWAEGSRMVFMTAHRRENQGETMRGMFRAIKRVIREHEDVRLIYPVHKSPAVRKAALEELGGHRRIKLAEPMDVVTCHNLMARSFMILTDSGGIQEEATCLGKPTLVLRTTTERMEGIEAGTLRLAGTEERHVYTAFTQMLDIPELHEKMARAANPYGDGHASERIVDILMREIK